MKAILIENSSRVHSLQYDEDNRELTIEFKRGGTYVYYDVSEDVYFSIINSESVGKAINLIVKGTYSYKKV